MIYFKNRLRQSSRTFYRRQKTRTTAENTKLHWSARPIAAYETGVGYVRQSCVMRLLMAARYNNNIVIIKMYVVFGVSIGGTRKRVKQKHNARVTSLAKVG